MFSLVQCTIFRINSVYCHVGYQDEFHEIYMYITTSHRLLVQTCEGPFPIQISCIRSCMMYTKTLDHFRPRSQMTIQSLDTLDSIRYNGQFLGQILNVMEKSSTHNVLGFMSTTRGFPF